MKRFLPIILTGIVVTVLIFGPINLKRAESQTLPPAQENPGYLPTCSIIPRFTLTNCVAVAGYYVLFVPTAALLWFAGQLFNGAVFIGLGGEVLRSDMVSIGWGIARDVANLFFIFILLYIAIATILQLSSYGMKSLLARLVIIALLVNFSLVITKVVIDASNILALEFYNKMTVEGGVVTRAIFGENARDISAVFLAGFNPQQLFASEEFGKWVTNTSGSTLIMLVLFLLASIMNLVAIFVLMAGGLLFIIRVAALWLLMILAPLAFLFMVLPKTQQYAADWWNKLFNQSFFAPAFLFLFYLVAKLINSGFLKSIFNHTPQGLSGIESFFASIFTVFLDFAVLAVLMIACLIVAQKMGAVGGSTAMSWGKAAGKWGRGYAGKATVRTARRAAAPTAEAIATSDKRWAKTLRAIPGVGRGAATIAASQRARTAEVQKGYEKYSSAELKNLTSRLMPLNRTAIIQELTKRNALKVEKGLTNDHLIKHRQRMKEGGMDTKDFDRLRPDIIDEYTEGANWRNTRNKALAKANWTEMDENTVQKIFSRENPYFEEDTGAIIKGSTSAVAKKLVEEVGGDAERAFFNSLKKLGTKMEDIADKLASPEIGNSSLASWIRGTPARPILKAHGIEAPPEKEEKPPLYDAYGRPIT